jgi:hypothetical protein
MVVSGGRKAAVWNSDNLTVIVIIFGLSKKNKEDHRHGLGYSHQI